MKNIREEDIVGRFTLKDGNKYIFLKDKTVYREGNDGELNEIKLTKKNIEQIRNDIGEGKTDVVR